jgi:hypothetical protein
MSVARRSAASRVRPILPMYRETYTKAGQKSFRYKCGAYTQSHGAVCTHNHVDGPKATRFAIGWIKQRLLSPTLLREIEASLERLAHSNSNADSKQKILVVKQNELARIRQDREIAQRNMARAKSDAQFAAISAEFEALLNQESLLEAEIVATSAARSAASDPAKDIAAALKQFERLRTLADGARDYAAARELFDLVDAKVFFRFRAAKWGERTVYSIGGGYLNFGATPPPVPIYEGRTGRVAVQMGKATNQPNHQEGGVEIINTGKRSNSLGNVSRGDRI